MIFIDKNRNSIQEAGIISLGGYADQQELPSGYEEVKKIKDPAFGMTIKLLYNEYTKEYIISYSGTSGPLYAARQWLDDSARAFANNVAKIDELYEYVYEKENNGVKGQGGNSAGFFWAMWAQKRYGGDIYGSGAMGLGVQKDASFRVRKDSKGLVEYPTSKHSKYYRAGGEVFVKQADGDIVDTVGHLLDREIIENDQTHIGYFPTSKGYEIRKKNEMMTSLSYSGNSEEIAQSIRTLQGYQFMNTFLAGLEVHTNRKDLINPQEFYKRSELTLKLYEDKYPGLVNDAGSLQWLEEFISTSNDIEKSNLSQPNRIVLDLGSGPLIEISEKQNSEDFHGFSIAQQAIDSKFNFLSHSPEKNTMSINSDDDSMVTPDLSAFGSYKLEELGQVEKFVPINATYFMKDFEGNYVGLNENNQLIIYPKSEHWRYHFIYTGSD